MNEYRMIEWVLFFYIYCFIGWCFESTYVSIKQKHWVNRGFLHGPFLPIYGSGAIMMLFVASPFKDNIFLTFLAGSVGATALEYVTGVVMEAIFKVRYWDYSYKKIQFQGHICLSSTIAWGFFTILLTKFIHKPIDTFVMSLPSMVVSIVTFLITIFFVADSALSIKAALDFRDVLVKLEKVKEEFERVQKRLDVMIALMDDSMETKKQERELKMNEVVEQIEEKFEQLKAKMPTLSEETRESIREELQELRTKYGMNKERRLQLRSTEDRFKRRLILGNPGMVSKKFKDSVEEIKNAVSEYVKKKK